MLRTAAQRKTLCADCPVARVADLLGDSCSILIIRDLLVKPLRFTDIEQSLSGISTRTLTNKLKSLESQQLIAKITHTTSPSRVEYKLTPKGAAFNKVLEAMRVYGAKYL